jgi:hypothetical protein
VARLVPSRVRSTLAGILESFKSCCESGPYFRHRGRFIQPDDAEAVRANDMLTMRKAKGEAGP